MTSRSRRGTAFRRKQQKYRIVDDDDDDDNDNDTACDEITKGSSNRFGGILASLNNKPPPKTKNSTKVVQNNALKPPSRTMKTKHVREVSPCASPRMPSSIVVGKTMAQDISPLPTQEVKHVTRSTNIGVWKIVWDDDTVTEGGDKDVSPGCDDEEKSQQKHTEMQDIHDGGSTFSSDSASEVPEETKRSLEENDCARDARFDAETFKPAIEYKPTAGTTDVQEASEEDLNTDDRNSEEDVNIYDSTSEDEFEFEDDEDFVPDEETESGSKCDSSEDNLSDFIVEDTPPPKKNNTRSQQTFVNESANEATGRQSTQGAPGSPVVEDNGTEISLSQEGQNENLQNTMKAAKDDQQEYVSHKLERTRQKSHTPPKSSVNTCDGDTIVLSINQSLVQSELDEGQSLLFCESPSTLNGGDDTEVEETPSRERPDCRALSFASPEPQIAIIVDEDDEDNDILDDGLVVVIVETESILEADGARDEPVPNDENGHDAEGTPSNDCTQPFNNSIRYEMEQLDSTNQNSQSSKTDPASSETKSYTEHIELISTVDGIPVTDQGFNTSDRPVAAKTFTKDKNIFFRQEGTVKRGKWRLGSQIGKGSFGDVFVGMNTCNGVLMAVKRFRIEGAILKDIRTEVELMRSLDHKNIVRYYGAEMDRKNLHVFQEWVPGGSVQTLLSKFGPFSIEVIQSYLLQTLVGLSYLHKNDVMHRDIKGSNILVNDEGIVKLADFGASKRLANLEENLMMSMTVRGTPYFMAPEVFEEKYSAKADIWGIGCVAHQMVIGFPPWKEMGFTNPISLFNHIKNSDGPPPMIHPSLSNFSKREETLWNLLQELACKCFDRDPSKRPSALDLQNDPFFLTVHDVEDDNSENYRGHFPLGHHTPESGLEDNYFPESIKKCHSPLKSSSPVFGCISLPDSKLQRSKSVVQWRSSFVSPPRPRKLPGESTGSPAQSMGTPKQMSTRSESLSPSPDTREWPEWARLELKKRIGSRASTSENGSFMYSDMTNMMGSLALSEDSEGASSNPSINAIPHNVGQSNLGASTTSKLVGLKFLESSSNTFEI
jgi:serine/threonine protein kinase